MEEQDFQYMDSEICVMGTSVCKGEENWKKIGLLAYNYEGKKESVIEKQNKWLINLDGRFKFGADMMQSYYKYYKTKNSCIFNSLPNSMADLVQRRGKL